MTNCQNDNAFCLNTIDNAMALKKDFPNIGAPYFRNLAPLFGKIFKPFNLIKNPLYPFTGSLRIVLGDIFSGLPYLFLGP